VGQSHNGSRLDLRTQELTSKATRGRPEGRFLGLLRGVSVVAVVTGAVGSIAFMLRVGHRAPRFLLVFFAIWITSPFIALMWANMVSKRWSILTQATLYSLTLVIALGTLAFYGDVVLRPPKSTPAFMFLVVPLGSWLLMTIIVPIAALISRRLSDRGAGFHD
jgi:hypothetical protein